MGRSSLFILSAGFALLPLIPPAPACCPAPPAGKPVVNADQTVILLWDPASKTEHFIRRASFKSELDDFGFLVPSPTRPDLSESGNEAFPYLQKLTEPEVKRVPLPSGSGGCSCGAAAPKEGGFKTKSVGAARQAAVRVLEEKVVAGFKASVLEADTTDVLVRWLKEHGYAFSPQVAAWAKPYVEKSWKITALKIARKRDRKDEGVTAAALRMSFKTERPLFPYREPDPTDSAAALNARHRLLRIYFLSEAIYRGELTAEASWTGSVAWAGELSAEDRKKTLEMLELPEKTGPDKWWLTEFEDDWPYRPAPADITFARSPNQAPVKRPPIIEYVSTSWPADGMVYALAAVVVGLPLVRHARRRGKR